MAPHHSGLTGSFVTMASNASGVGDAAQPTPGAAGDGQDGAGCPDMLLHPRASRGLFQALGWVTPPFPLKPPRLFEALFPAARGLTGTRSPVVSLRLPLARPHSPTGTPSPPLNTLISFCWERMASGNRSINHQRGLEMKIIIVMNGLLFLF